jgi:hypothetical protein
VKARLVFCPRLTQPWHFLCPRLSSAHENIFSPGRNQSVERSVYPWNAARKPRRKVPVAVARLAGRAGIVTAGHDNITFVVAGFDAG